jgi:hypothetical protein
MVVSSQFFSYSMPAAKKSAGVKRKAPGRPPKATTRSSSAKSSSEESEDEVFFTTPSVEDVIQQALPHMVEALLPRITEQVSSQMAAQEHRSPPSQYQGSLPGQLRDRRDFDDEPMEEALQHHVRMITGERGGDDEDGAFSYNLTERELVRIQMQEFVDFAAIYRRQLRGPYASLQQDEIPTKGVALEVIPITEWVRIFSAFLVEHQRAFPKDALTLPKYLDLIMQMEANGMDWATYDLSFRLQRAKRARRASVLSPWSKTNIELYIGCQAQPQPRATPRAPKAKAAATSFSPGSSSTDNMKSGTCWKFQYGKGCDGTCMWPHTHICEKCSGPHPTKQCGTSSGAQAVVTVSAPPPVVTEAFRDSQRPAQARESRSQEKDRHGRR